MLPAAVPKLLGVKASWSQECQVQIMPQERRQATELNKDPTRERRDRDQHGCKAFSERWRWAHRTDRGPEIGSNGRTCTL